VGVVWFEQREYRCKLHAESFARQVENISRDAIKDLKVGTNKLDVARFFAERGIPLAIVESEAYASLRTSGCAPLGCGTDVAFVTVRVKLDATGAVAEIPKVSGVYKDCL